MIVPLRLFVCFGLCVTVVTCFVRLGGDAAFVFPRAGAGTVSGESRIVDGDGILISSIPGRSSTFTGAQSRAKKRKRETSGMYEIREAKMSRAR